MQLETRMRSNDLHGSAPDSARAALLIVDMLNPFDFEGADELLGPAHAASERLAELRARAREARMPVVYANDNFGRWRSDQRALLERVLDSPGAEIAKALAPGDDDYFVVKPKHSGFYSTTLELLLGHLGTRRLIVTGVQTHICVLFTANDAYMRDLEILVPEDCVASEEERDREAALALMRSALEADTRASTGLDCAALLE